ncbi:hypothetical protein AJ80_08784 [Polytolypa hystricis UAMH7299]|uniref:Amino acid permease/ SLC12A domain-containing protein n=1 Tax=Polytolypa hystricis (strain UAMH7299) TaxID=1447883 RepID=A0A2B7X1E7_POLH7|nr:hypothetical protein AJ80_08784 [Polytolypa hystricis UAMH7299]
MEAKSFENDPDMGLTTADSISEEKRAVADEHVQIETKRGLSARHIQLITIAGGIGVGLFVGIGGVLSKAGPINVVLGYLFYSCAFIWPITLNMAEMVSWLPIRGSIYELASRFVDPALGFSMGWTYFFAGAMMVCTEYSAVATVVQYWDTSINPAVWVAIVIAVCYFLNMVAVKWYGEAEFLMSSTKVLLLIGLIFLTFITMVGGNPKKDVYGFRHWTDGNAMHSYYAPGPTGRFLGFWISARYAAFTVGGPDIIALSAGEIQNPRRVIPKVARMVVQRIVLFYIVGVVAVGIICPSRDSRLLGAISSGEGSATASPWVIGILKLGIGGFLPGLINALILLSGWSCGNAFLYSSSRTLYSLAKDGHAPKILLKCNKAGVPWVAVTAVTAITFLTFLVSSNQASQVFQWFLELTTVSMVVNATSMSWAYLGWYRALKAQGIARVTKKNADKATRGIVFPYLAPFSIYTACLSLVIGCSIMIFIGFDYFVPWSTRGFITSYFGLAWFWVMFFFWKIFKRTRFVNPAEVDIFAGGLKHAIDEECKHWEDGFWQEREKERRASLNVFMRAWDNIWGR